MPRQFTFGDHDSVLLGLFGLLWGGVPSSNNKPGRLRAASEVSERIGADELRGIKDLRLRIRKVRGMRGTKVQNTVV
jgi:hypothetical protein